MFGFLKKLFGHDAATNKEAGVQIEQVPYKVEKPAMEDLADIAIAQSILADKVKAANEQPVAKNVAPATKAAPKKTAEKKPAVKKDSAKKSSGRGRKPKAK
jgi:hypothetical protein